MAPQLLSDAKAKAEREQKVGRAILDAGFGGGEDVLTLVLSYLGEIFHPAIGCFLMGTTAVVYVNGKKLTLNV
jgi:hypothetical protein